MKRIGESQMYREFKKPNFNWEEYVAEDMEIVDGEGSSTIIPKSIWDQDLLILLSQMGDKERKTLMLEKINEVFYSPAAEADREKQYQEYRRMVRRKGLDEWY